jgi:hypothetical protein
MRLPLPPPPSVACSRSGLTTPSQRSSPAPPFLGFAIAGGRTSAIAIQAVSMLAFAIVAYIGIVEDSQAFIGAGWIAHGFWDASQSRGPRANRCQDLVPAVFGPPRISSSASPWFSA